ncbi:MAG: helix-turn-helix domain-containing protein, partial [Jatrophihabitantaceae bacterium]
AALGWAGSGSIVAVVGNQPDGAPRDVLADTHSLTRRLGLDAMAGVHGNRLVIVFGGAGDPAATASTLVPAFGDGPIVISPVAAEVNAASDVTRAALSGLRAVAAWPGAPRPVSAEALLPERTLAGDADARESLIEAVYRPLVEAGDVLVETVSTFLETGGALESTARALFVHANTVRYRLRRVAEVCGETPSDPRGAFTLRLALTLGRLEQLG